MKRKFLSMMVAACAALFSVSGLTCCGGGGGGGGDDGNGLNYLTLDGYSKQRHGFSLMGSAVYLDIRPVGTVDGAPNNNTGSTRIMEVQLSNAEGTVSTQARGIYEIILPADDPYTETPSQARFTLTLAGQGETTDPNVLAAFGLNVTSNANGVLVNSVVMTLTFWGNGYGTVDFQVDGTSSGTDVITITDVENAMKSVWGKFMILR